MNKLYDLVLGDTCRRLSVFGLAGLLTLICSLVELWGLHRTEETVYDSVPWILLFNVLVSAIIFYVVRVASFFKSEFSWRTKSVGGVTAFGVLLVLLNVDVPKIQSMAADYSLGIIAAKFDTVHAANITPVQAQRQFDKLQTIVTASALSRIPVSPERLNTVHNAVSNYLDKSGLPDSTRQAGWRTAIDVESLSLNRQADTGTINSRSATTLGAQINSTLEFNHDVYMTGDNSNLVFNGGQISVEHATAVFNRINFVSLITSGWLLVPSKDAHVFVQDSVFVNGTQQIDGITWLNVEFRGTWLIYRGGSIRLHNVVFKDFERNRVMAYLPPELAMMILDSKSKPISYSSDSNASHIIE
jgi:hypothetical protein